MKTVKKISRTVFTIAWCMVSVYIIAVLGASIHFRIGTEFVLDFVKWSYQYETFFTFIRWVTGIIIIQFGLIMFCLPFLRTWNNNFEVWRKARKEKRLVKES